MEPRPIVVRPVPTEQIVLVCRKCTGKLDGGFGKKRRATLRDVLRDTLKRLGRRRTVRVIETGCLGLCPKKAVTVASSARPGALLAVPAGSLGEDIIAHIGAPGGDNSNTG